MPNYNFPAIEARRRQTLANPEPPVNPESPLPEISPCPSSSVYETASEASYVPVPNESEVLVIPGPRIVNTAAVPGPRITNTAAVIPGPRILNSAAGVPVSKHHESEPVASTSKFGPSTRSKQLKVTSSPRKTANSLLNSFSETSSPSKVGRNTRNNNLVDINTHSNTRVDSDTCSNTPVNSDTTCQGTVNSSPRNTLNSFSEEQQSTPELNFSIHEPRSSQLTWAPEDLDYLVSLLSPVKHSIKNQLFSGHMRELLNERFTSSSDSDSDSTFNSNIGKSISSSSVSCNDSDTDSDISMSEIQFLRMENKELISADSMFCNKGSSQNIPLPSNQQPVKVIGVGNILFNRERLNQESNIHGGKGLVREVENQYIDSNIHGDKGFVQEVENQESTNINKESRQESLEDSGDEEAFNTVGEKNVSVGVQENRVSSSQELILVQQSKTELVDQGSDKIVKNVKLALEPILKTCTSIKTTPKSRRQSRNDKSFPDISGSSLENTPNGQKSLTLELSSCTEFEKSIPTISVNDRNIHEPMSEKPQNGGSNSVMSSSVAQTKDSESVTETEDNEAVAGKDDGESFAETEDDKSVTDNDESDKKTEDNESVTETGNCKSVTENSESVTEMENNEAVTEKEDGTSITESEAGESNAVSQQSNISSELISNVHNMSATPMSSQGRICSYHEIQGSQLEKTFEESQNRNSTCNENLSLSVDDTISNKLVLKLSENEISVSDDTQDFNEAPKKLNSINSEHFKWSSNCNSHTKDDILSRIYGKRSHEKKKKLKNPQSPVHEASPPVHQISPSPHARAEVLSEDSHIYVSSDDSDSIMSWKSRSRDDPSMELSSADSSFNSDAVSGILSGRVMQFVSAVVHNAMEDSQDDISSQNLSSDSERISQVLQVKQRNKYRDNHMECLSSSYEKPQERMYNSHKSSGGLKRLYSADCVDIGNFRSTSNPLEASVPLKKRLRRDNKSSQYQDVGHSSEESPDSVENIEGVRIINDEITHGIGSRLNETFTTVSETESECSKVPFLPESEAPSDFSEINSKMISSGKSDHVSYETANLDCTVRPLNPECPKSPLSVTMETQSDSSLDSDEIIPSSCQGSNCDYNERDLVQKVTEIRESLNCGQNDGTINHETFFLETSNCGHKEAEESSKRKNISLTRMKNPKIISEEISTESYKNQNRIIGKKLCVGTDSDIDPMTDQNSNSRKDSDEHQSGSCGSVKIFVGIKTNTRVINLDNSKVNVVNRECISPVGISDKTKPSIPIHPNLSPQRSLNLSPRRTLYSSPQRPLYPSPRKTLNPSPPKALNPSLQKTLNSRSPLSNLNPPEDVSTATVNNNSSPVFLRSNAVLRPRGLKKRKPNRKKCVPDSSLNEFSIKDSDVSRVSIQPETDNEEIPNPEPAIFEPAAEPFDSPRLINSGPNSNIGTGSLDPILKFRFVNDSSPSNAAENSDTSDSRTRGSNLRSGSPAVNHPFSVAENPDTSNSRTHGSNLRSGSPAVNPPSSPHSSIKDEPSTSSSISYDSDNEVNSVNSRTLR